MDTEDTKRQILWFLSVTFFITYAFGASVYFLGVDQELSHVVMMLVPMLVAFGVQRFIVKEPVFRGGHLGFVVGTKRYLLIGPLVALLVMLAGYLVTCLIDPNLFTRDGGSTSRTVKVLLVNLLLGPILNLPIHLGEEVGWRGFMYPRLIRLYRKPGLVIGGIIWGLYHMPAILMGHNYPDHPIPGVFLMCILSVFLGIIFQYYYQKSGSILVPALCHGMINMVARTANQTVVDVDKFQDLIHAPVGLIGIVVLAFPALWFYTKFHSKAPS